MGALSPCSVPGVAPVSPAGKDQGQDGLGCLCSLRNVRIGWKSRSICRHRSAVGAGVMGGTSSTRRVTFETDENENITVVKGIRLSENVIGRMKESSPSDPKSPTRSRSYDSKVNEEGIRRRVAEEMAMKDSESQKSRAKHGKIQAREDINKLLERERSITNEQLTRAILLERASSEEEKSKVKHLAKQLEEKDRVLKKQDAFYKEQLARLEERGHEARICSRLIFNPGQECRVL